MAEYQANSVNWDDDFQDSTSGPSISAIAEEVPTLTVATILGVTIVILIAIVMVFVLGILIDCRQQRLLDKKLLKVKRLKKRKVNEQNADEISISNNMEQPGTSAPPAEVLRHIP